MVANNQTGDRHAGEEVQRELTSMVADLFETIHHLNARVNVLEELAGKRAVQRGHASRIHHSRRTIVCEEVAS